MPITSTTTKVTGNGNGSATVFSFSPMVIYASTNLTVVHVDADGVETTLTEGTGATNYSILVSRYPGTGSIVYPADEVTPMPTGESVIIKPVLPLTQTIDLNNRGGYYPDVLETGFDKLVRIALQQQEEIDRSVKLPISSDEEADTLSAAILAVEANAAASEGNAAASASAAATSEASAASAAASAAGVNMPPVTVGDAGKAAIVKSDGSGWETTAAVLGDAATKDVDVAGGVQSYDADTLKADTDDVLAAAFGQGYDALGSLDAMTTDTLTITIIGTSNRKSLTVDVDGTIVVTNMAAGAVLIRATNSGARSLTITGATVTANSAAFDGTASAVNLLLFESDGTTVDLTIDQRGS